MVATAKGFTTQIESQYFNQCVSDCKENNDCISACIKHYDNTAFLNDGVEFNCYKNTIPTHCDNETLKYLEINGHYNGYSKYR